MASFNIRTVGLVYRKELLDIIRDRRTLVSMILIPILIFPLITIGFGSFATKAQADLESQEYIIFAVGTEWSPEIFKRLKEGKGYDLQDFGNDIENAMSLLQDKQVRAVLEFPIESELDSTEIPLFKLHSDFTDDRSRVAQKKLKKVMDELKLSLAAEKLEQMNLPKTVVNPFKYVSENIASDEQMAGLFLAVLLPYMLIILTLTGGMYPAMDLTAGEKERSTLETLLVTPASRAEIVLGKYLTILTSSLVTALVSLSSMAIVFSYGLGVIAPELANEGSGLSINISLLLLALAMIIPLAMLFASLLLMVGISAKSIREAQSYMSPLIMVAILPAMMTMLPGASLSNEQMWIPIVNVSLVMKDILTNQINPSQILNVLVSNFIYAGIAMVITVKVFEREGVLFKV